jgi:hypothetical protein
MQVASSESQQSGFHSMPFWLGKTRLLRTRQKEIPLTFLMTRCQPTETGNPSVRQNLHDCFWPKTSLVAVQANGGVQGNSGSRRRTAQATRLTFCGSRFHFIASPRLRISLREGSKAKTGALRPSGVISYSTSLMFNDREVASPTSTSRSAPCRGRPSEIRAIPPLRSKSSRRR